MPPRKPGHVGKPVRRRRKGGHGEGEEGGAERWLVTYADMLTLLLVLFIVLFSISVVNTSKFIALKTSLSAAFGDGPKGVLDGGNALNQNSAEQSGPDQLMPGVPVTPPDPSKATAASKADLADQQALAAKAAREVKDFRKIEKAINDSLAHNGLSGAVQFAIDRRGLIITVITNALVFPGNSANLLSEGQHILAVIAPPLVHTKHNIEVDGHTNQEKVSTYPYPSGWELSSARASAVVRYLAAHGVSQSRLSAVGYSDQRPLYPASDPRSVTRNRRVEIVVLTSLPANAGDALAAAAGAK
jgi:chemotaxis protein MotB